MNIRVTPASRLCGTVSAVRSKSYGHRALIAASLSGGPCAVRLAGPGQPVSEDISATISCMCALGAEISLTDGLAVITGFRPVSSGVRLDCGESGSTARFLLPVAAALCENFGMTGWGRLPARPFSVLCEQMERRGCAFSSHSLPMRVSGYLQSGKYALPGNISSQYISGLLFALPLLGGDSCVTVTSPLESAAYVDMTAEILSLFGIKTKRDGNIYRIAEGQVYKVPEGGFIDVEGDWSNAAFFLCMNALGSDIEVKGLNPTSLQGDRKITELLRQLTIVNCQLSVDVSQIPDLVPALAVVAACREGGTIICGGVRLRTKESDRLVSTAAMINALGGAARETADGLVITGTGELAGGTVQSFGDHRIVMAAVTAAGRCVSPVTIIGAEAVNKSYPHFFEDYRKAGGGADVIDAG